jgi:hypothetical protein
MSYSCFYSTNKMPDHQIDRVVMLMRDHANRSARGMRHRWKLHWHHDQIGITFDLRDDWRFFKRTYPDAFAELFNRQSYGQ